MEALGRRKTLGIVDPEMRNMFFFALSARRVVGFELISQKLWLS